MLSEVLSNQCVVWDPSYVGPVFLLYEIVPLDLNLKEMWCSLHWVSRIVSASPLLWTRTTFPSPLFSAQMWIDLKWRLVQFCNFANNKLYTNGEKVGGIFVIFLSLRWKKRENRRERLFSTFYQILIASFSSNRTDLSGIYIKCGFVPGLVWVL